MNAIPPIGPTRQAHARIIAVGAEKAQAPRKRGQPAPVVRFDMRFQDRTGRTFSARSVAPDAGQADRLLGYVRDLIRVQGSSHPMQPATVDWLATVGPEWHKRLQAWGLLAPSQAAAVGSLAEVIDDWTAALQAKAAKKGRNRSQRAAEARRAVEGVFTEAKITHVHQISESAVDAALDSLATTRAPATIRQYQQGVMQFARWCYKRRLLPEDPLRGLEIRDASPQWQRRTCSPEEQAWFFTYLETAPSWTGRRGRNADTQTREPYTLTGPDRAMFYEIALETGLRCSEVLAATRCAEMDHATEPALYIPADFTKDHKPAYQPLPLPFAEKLRKRFGHLPIGSPFFPGLVNSQASAYFDRDREQARKAYIAAAKTPAEHEVREKSTFLAKHDGQGRVLGLHSLRATYATDQQAAGAPAQVVSRNTRHRSLAVLDTRYTHLGDADRRNAVTLGYERRMSSRNQAVARYQERYQTSPDMPGHDTTPPAPTDGAPRADSPQNTDENSEFQPAPGTIIREASVPLQSVPLDHSGIRPMVHKSMRRARGRHPGSAPRPQPSNPSNAPLVASWSTYFWNSPIL